MKNMIFWAFFLITVSDIILLAQKNLFMTPNICNRANFVVSLHNKYKTT